MRAATGLTIVTFVALYLLAGGLAALCSASALYVSPLWPAAGVGLGMLAFCGIAFWPVTTLMHLLILSVAFSTSLPVAAMQAISGTLAVVLAAALIRRRGHEPFATLRFQNAYAFLTGAFAAAFVGAAGGTATLWFSSPGGETLQTLGLWFLNDLFGALVITPMVVGMARWYRDGSEAAEGRVSRYETTFWWLLLGAALALQPLVVTTTNYALSVATIPLILLLWSAMRFPAVMTSLAAGATALGYAIFASLGLGGFVPPAEPSKQAGLLLYLALLSLLPQGIAFQRIEWTRAQTELRRKAVTDRLTGLLSRSNFEDCSLALTEQRLVGEACVAIAHIDIDNFRIINDQANHRVGDAFLRGVASILRHQLSTHGFAARLGGDEFGVALQAPDKGQARAVIEEVLAAIREHRVVENGRGFRLTASAGLAIVTRPAADLTRLLADADAACRTAKELGGDRVRVAELDDAELERYQAGMRRATEIVEALDSEGFVLTAQPIAACGAATEVPHFEILLRMRRPQDLAAAEFIGAAEHHQLMVRIDTMVVGRAFSALAKAQHDGFLAFINLSGASLADEHFHAHVGRELEKHRINPQQICFEITETAAVRNLAAAQAFMRDLRSLGLRFALDDFGAGLASFAYLKQLEFDFLKIDGAFVRDILDDQLDLALVRSIHDIAQVLGRKTIAEHVENQAVYDKLKELGIDYAQGWYLGKPTSLEEMISNA